MSNYCDTLIQGRTCLLYRLSAVRLSAGGCLSSAYLIALVVVLSELYCRSYMEKYIASVLYNNSQTNTPTPTNIHQFIYRLPPRLIFGNSTGTLNLATLLAAASAFPPLTFHLANSDSRGFSTRQPSSRKYCRIVWLSSRRSSRRSDGSQANSLGGLPPLPSLPGCGGTCRDRAQMVVWRRVISFLERVDPCGENLRRIESTKGSGR